MVKKKLSLLGGDKREIVVANALIKAGYDIKVFGLPKEKLRDNKVYCSSVSQAVKDADVVILPVRGLDEKGVLYAPFIAKEIIITQDDFHNTAPSAEIFVGVASPYLKELGESANIKILQVMELDPIAVPNAIPTAEGALAMAIEKSPLTIDNSKVLILGFGRVAKATAKVFQALGARIFICSRNPEEIAAAKEKGYDVRRYNGLTRILPHAHVVINTVPALVLKDEILAYTSPDVLIIDLASIPGGVDFAAAKRRDINAIHALGLPGKCAPITAGKILAKGLIHLLETERS
ncbi:MAG: dipicolinate synthase subunit DpsA [Clostridiales bacterium]